MKEWKILAKAFVCEIKAVLKMLKDVPSKVKPFINGSLIGVLLSALAFIAPLAIMVLIYGEKGKPGVFNMILFAVAWVAWVYFIMRVYGSYLLLIQIKRKTPSVHGGDG